MHNFGFNLCQEFFDRIYLWYLSHCIFHCPFVPSNERNTQIPAYVGFVQENPNTENVRYYKAQNIVTENT